MRIRGYEFVLGTLLLRLLINFTFDQSLILRKS
jgi:hypothetical protein